MNAIQRGLKRLEIGWRRMWIGAITAMLRRRSASAPPDWDHGHPRVLFLRHDRIGDMIVTTGVLRAIARSHPNLELDVLASPSNAPILTGDPDIHGVVVFDKKRPLGYLSAMRQLRATRYDAVVDCMVTAPSLTTLLLMLASGARHRIGIAGRGLESALTIAVPPLVGDGHLVRHLARLTIPFGVDPERADFSPAVPLTAVERERAEHRWTDAGLGTRLLVNISAGTSERRWPAARYIEVIGDALRRWPSLRVFLLSSPGDAAEANVIATATGATYVPTAGIRDALALVSAADVVLTPDTSIAHATDAFRVPVVVIFGRDKAVRWKPFVTRVRTIEWHEPGYENLPAALVSAELQAQIADVITRSSATSQSSGVRL